MSENKREYVFVTWDPLLEQVVCVHKKYQDECDKCEKLRKKRHEESWWLETKKFMVR